MNSNNKSKSAREWPWIEAFWQFLTWTAASIAPDRTRQQEPETQPQSKTAGVFSWIKRGLCTIIVVLLAVSVDALARSIANKFTFGSGTPAPARRSHSHPHYVNTSCFKSGISEIANLVQVDYTPMYRLATTLNEAVSLVQQMKHGASYALGKTGVSKQDAREILRFFDQVTDDLYDTESVADKASEFYHEQKVQLGSIRESLQTMQRSISKTNVPGFVREVKYIIKRIDTSVKEIRIIKDALRKQKKKMTMHKGTASGHITKVKGSRKSAEQKADQQAAGAFKTAVVIGGGVASFVNPLAGLGVVLMGMMEHGGIQENKQKTLEEYDNALALFHETLEVLDDCVKAIGDIEEHLNAVKANLNEIPKGADKLLFELSKVEEEDVVITKDDREELNARFKFVLSLVEKSEIMYRFDRNIADI